MMMNSELGPRIAEFVKGIQASKKGLKKLKKKTFGLITSNGQLEIEVKAAQAILDGLEQATNKGKEELERLDFEQLKHVAISLVKDAGYKVDFSEPIRPFDEMKVAVIERLRISVLGMLSASIGSFLNPLEAVTRYPDRSNITFDENYPYVRNFTGLCNVITHILEKSQESYSHIRPNN
jgi:hypothetical protein